MGGSFWEEIAEDSSLAPGERASKLVDRYLGQMRTWFKTVAAMPIREKEVSATPKYWLLWGSRWQRALPLINDGSAFARRAQLEEWGAETLYAAAPLSVVPSEAQREEAVSEVAREIGTATWEELQWAVIARDVGRFKSSEINAAIKALLAAGKLVGPTPERIDLHATVRAP